MILNKQQILDRIVQDGMVSGYSDLKEQLQPAGFDLTVAKVYKFKTQGAIDFDNSKRKISDVEELAWDKEGWLTLPMGTYKIQYAEQVRMPADIAGQNILRSSLMRCGCILHQGFWDPGYSGKGESTLYVGNPEGLRLKKGAKVAQMVFYKLASPADELYQGIHQNENV